MEPKPKPKPKRARRVLLCILFTLGLIAVLIAVTPWILSSDAVRDAIVEGINEAIPGRVSAGGIKLRWTAGQTLEDVELHDPEGRLVLRIERVLTEVSLIGLATGKLDLGVVRVLGLQADLERDANGELNLVRAVDRGDAEPDDAGAKPEDRHQAALPKGLRLRLEVEQGQVSYREPGLEEPLVLDALDAAFTVDGSGEPWNAEINGLERGSDVAFAIEAALDVCDDQGRIDERRMSAQAQVKADWESADAEKLRGVFGRGLVLNLTAQREGDRSDLTLRAEADRLALEGEFVAGAGNELTLAKPLRLRWSPDPRAFTPDPDAELPAEVRIELDVERLHWPVDRLDDLTLEARCSLSDGVARVPVAGEMQEIAWSGWALRVKAKPLGDELQANLEGNLRSGGESGAVALDARAQYVLDSDRAQVDGTFRVREFPIDALDRLLGGITGRPGLLVDLLGDRLEVEAKCETRSDHSVTVELDARSPRLKLVAPLSIDLRGSRIEAKDVSGRLTLPEAVVKQLMPSLELEGEVPVTLKIDRFEAPFDRFVPAISGIDAELGFRGVRIRGEKIDGNFRAKKNADRNEFEGSATLVLGPGGSGIISLKLSEPVWDGEGALMTDELTGALEAQFLEIPIETVERLTGLDGVLVESCGSTLKGTISAVGDGSKARFESKFSAERFNARVEGSLDAERRVRLDASSSVTLTPALAERIGVELATPVEALVKAPDLRFSLPFDAAGLRGDVTVSSETFGVNRVEVRELEARVALGNEGANATLQCTAKSQEDRLSDALGGPVTVKASGHRPWGSDAVTARIDLKSVLTHFGLDARYSPAAGVAITGEGGVRNGKDEKFTPASLSASLDPDGNATVAAKAESFPLAVLDGRLADLFGDRAALDVKVIVPDEARVSVHSSVVDLEAEVELGETIRLRRPTTAKWSLTPRSWSALVGDEQSGFRLGGPATVALRLDRIVYAPEDPAALDLQASAEIERLVLAERESGERATLRSLKLGVVGRDLRKPLRITMDGLVEDPVKPGRIRGHLDLMAWDAKSQKAHLNPAALSFESRFQLDEIPVGSLDRALGLEGRGLAVLGDRVSAITESHLQAGRGPVSIRLTSGNAKADLALRVDRRMVRLEKPMEAQIDFNDRLAAVVLPELGPLFKGVESTEQPIKLRIEQQGFSMPLDRFDVKRLTIPRMRIDIGRVVLNNLWLADVVQQVTRSGRPDKRTSTWFTPLELEMRNGVIRYRSRLDLLTQESMHLSSWGSVDLGRKRLDLTLAFMTDSLRRHLGVKKARDGDTLQVPIRGSLDKPQVDLRAALAGLAQVRAEVEAADKIKEKWARALIEATLDALLKKTLRASPVPNASVDPLPWTAPPNPLPRRGDGR